MTERWLPAPGCEGYEVSDCGRVRKASSGRIVSQFPTPEGYRRIAVHRPGRSKRNVRVHRLVAMAFVENPEPEVRTQVNHINEDKTDNRAANLEWVTASGNINHGTANARRAAAAARPVVMLYQGMCIRFDSAVDAERRTGIPAQSIQRCCAGRATTTHGAAFAYEIGG